MSDMGIYNTYDQKTCLRFVASASFVKKWVCPSLMLICVTVLTGCGGLTTAKPDNSVNATPNIADSGALNLPLTTTLYNVFYISDTQWGVRAIPVDPSTGQTAPSTATPLFTLPSAPVPALDSQRKILYVATTKWPIDCHFCGNPVVGENTLYWFLLDPANHTLHPGPGSPIKYDDSFWPGSVVPTPDGSRLYVRNGIYSPIGMRIYAVQADGALTEQSNSPLPASAVARSVFAANGLAYSYVPNADFGHPELGAFAVGQDGTLQSIGTTAPGPVFPTSLLPSPDGQHLYIAGDNALYGYAISPDGTIRPLGKQGPSYLELGYLRTFDRTGRFVVVDYLYGTRVLQRDVSTGTLTELPGSPFSLVNSETCTQFGVTVPGEVLYCVGTELDPAIRNTLFALPFDPNTGTIQRPGATANDLNFINSRIYAVP